MRLVLKLGETIVSVFWIKRRSHDLIGWFKARHLEQSFAPGNDRPSDVHFRYPIDGNIHWSLKYYNAARHLARVESYYPEVVRSKTRTPDSWSIVERARSDWERENEPVVLLPSRRLPPLIEYLQGPKFFAFPTAGFNIFPGEPCRMFNANSTQIRRDDFVVDVTRPYSVSVNYSVFLLGKDIDKELSTRPLDGETFRERDARGFPMIEFRVLINPLASSIRE